MSTRLAHRAQLYAMNMTIQVLIQTRQNKSMSAMFRSFYQIFCREVLILWTAIFVALSLTGYLFGYVLSFLLPR